VPTVAAFLYHQERDHQGSGDRLIVRCASGARGIRQGAYDLRAPRAGSAMRPLKNNWMTGIACSNQASQPVLARRKADFRLDQPAVEDQPATLSIGSVLVLQPRQDIFCIKSASYNI
jgi:hypothetical protein